MTTGHVILLAATVWWVLTLAAIIALSIGMRMARRANGRERSAAAARAREMVGK